MDNTKNVWMWIVVVALVIGAYYVGTSSNNQPATSNNNQDNSVVPTQETVAQQNQNTPVVTPKPKVPPVQNTYTNFELSENPNYLFNKDFSPYKAKVYGAGVGDSYTQINQVSIIQQQEYAGWVHTTKGTGYRIVNGTIAEIALNNDGMANLVSKDEVIIKFGQPDRFTTTGTSPYTTDTYYYISRGIVVYDYVTNGGIKVNIIGN